MEVNGALAIHVIVHNPFTQNRSKLQMYNVGFKFLKKMLKSRNIPLSYLTTYGSSLRFTRENPKTT